MWRTCLTLVLVAPVACKAPRKEVVVFHASSLSSVLSDAAELFRKQNPQVQVRLEPSGSQVAARKVSELGMRADIVAVADAQLVAKLLLPSHAAWSVVFATNELVIAHKDHSKGTDQITTQNWPELLTREGVRLGRGDPDTAPIGYQTLMAWQLAERTGLYGSAGAGLTVALKAKCAKEHVTHDEGELLALLESRAIDYAFLFRSTAEDHHLKVTALPPEINLSRQDLAADYAKVQVAVRMKQGQGGAADAMIVGAPVTYGLTMPTTAPHRDLAERFLSLLLGPEGKRLLERRGFHALSPTCAPCDGLPTSLVGVVTVKAR
jgi:molybdate/tungstate transport system substrate-binding protein